MKFELVDSLCLAGDPAKANDDAFAFRDNASAVLDGATGLGGQLLPGPSDAAWLARFGANRLMSYFADGASPQDAVTASLFDAQTSFERLRRREPIDRYEIPYASLMLAVLGANGVDFIWYGDCAALVRHDDGRVEIVGEALVKRAREAERVKQLAESEGEASAGASVRETYLPALRAVRNRVNTPKGGYLFGPDVIAADHAAASHSPIAAGAHILLVTDGFLALAGDYQRYDVAGLLKAAIEKGLPPLGRELRSIEDGDPEGRQYPRFKKSDDATAVLLKVAAA